MLSTLALALLAAPSHASPAKLAVCDVGHSLYSSEACICVHAPSSEWVGGHSGKGWPAVSHATPTSGGSVSETITDTCFDAPRYLNATDVPGATDRARVAQLITMRGHGAAAHADTAHGKHDHGFQITLDQDDVCTSSDLMSMDGGEAYRMAPIRWEYEDRVGDQDQYAIVDEDGAVIAQILTNGEVPVAVYLWPYDDDDEPDLIIGFEEHQQWWIAGPFEDDPYEPPEDS